MRSAVAILLALTLWPTAGLPAPLRVVFVTVAGGASWDDAARAAALADAQAALNWWHARGIAAPSTAVDGGDLEVASVESWAWLPEPTGGLVLYLVANAGIPLGIGPQGAYAGAYVNRGRMVLLQEGVVPRPAAIAHELGHALLLLPDWPAPCRLDILCEPTAAYEAGMLGCTTLQALGMPCSYVYLPEVRP